MSLTALAFSNAGYDQNVAQENSYDSIEVAAVQADKPIERSVELSKGVNIGNGMDMSNGVARGNSVGLGNSVMLSNGVSFANGVNMANGLHIANGVELGQSAGGARQVEVGSGLTMDEGLAGPGCIDFAVSLSDVGNLGLESNFMRYLRG